MTIDERIEKLATAQEKTQVIMAEILDSIKRLERITLADTLDIDAKLDELEAKRAKRRGHKC